MIHIDLSQLNLRGRENLFKDLRDRTLKIEAIAEDDLWYDTPNLIGARGQLQRGQWFGSYQFVTEQPIEIEVNGSTIMESQFIINEFWAK